MNVVSLIGRLTKEPEARYTSGNNTATTSFSLAVSKDFKKDGQPEADFINIVTWGKTAEFAAKYFTKGLQVGIVGRIQTRSWEKDGQRHYVTEVAADRVYFADAKRETTASTQKLARSESDDGFYPTDDLNSDTLPF